MCFWGGGGGGGGGGSRWEGSLDPRLRLSSKNGGGESLGPRLPGRVSLTPRDGGGNKTNLHWEGRDKWTDHWEGRIIKARVDHFERRESVGRSPDYTSAWFDWICIATPSLPSQ